MDAFTKFRYRTVLEAFKAYSCNVKRTTKGVRWNCYDGNDGFPVEKWLKQEIMGINVKFKIQREKGDIPLFDSEEITTGLISEIVEYIEKNY